MSAVVSMCLTCLSNLEEGAKLTETLSNFLCDVLHFKPELVQKSPKIICRKCYKTLIELKCFYTQLRDVEVYYESKSKIKIDPDNFLEEDDVEEPYIGELECTVSIADDSKLDPILIDEDEDCCVVENNVLKQKTSDTTSGRRFVCLTCSALFISFDDLRSHERTHLPPPIEKTSPIFLAARKQVSCSECGQEFYNKYSMEAHMKKHKKVRPFYCMICKHRFANKEQLVNHEARYECVVCHIKCCSRKALEVHMKEKHIGYMNGISVDNKTDIHQQYNIIAQQQDP